MEGVEKEFDYLPIICADYIPDYELEKKSYKTWGEAWAAAYK